MSSTRRGITVLVVSPGLYELIEWRSFDTHDSGGGMIINGGSQQPCGGSPSS